MNIKWEKSIHVFYRLVANILNTKRLQTIAQNAIIQIE